MAKGNEKVFSGSIPSDDSLLSGAPAFPYSSTLAGGLFTPTPLDLPAAHSPVDIDYDAEGSVSAAPPILMSMGMGMGRSFQLGGKIMSVSWMGVMSKGFWGWRRKSWRIYR